MAARKTAVPGEVEVKTQTPQASTETTTQTASETQGERVPISFEEFDALTEEFDALQAQYDALLASFNLLNSDPDALQERLHEIKPELKNPNLANDMASRPSRPVSVGGKLTDKGWIV